MLNEFWRNRYRPKLLTREWLKYWCKRVLLTRQLLAQYLGVSRLRLCGAKVTGPVFLANVSKITGDLSKLEIGCNTFMGRITIACHDSVHIGSKVVINDEVRLLTASHDLRDSQWKTVTGAITIRDYAWIATGATILPGVTIGQGAVVGCSAVVTTDVPDYGLAVGNPAKILENKRTQTLAYNPLTRIALYEAWYGRQYM